MVIGHMAKITQAQLGIDLGFLLVAVLAVGNAAGRIGAGIVADRLGSARTMTLVFSAQTLVLALTGFANTVLLLSAAAFLIGFNYGADLSLFPLIITEYFGQANQGVNYGVVFTSWGVGGVFGSMAGGAIVDATGTYLPAFAVAAALCAVAAGISVVTRPPDAQGFLSR
jgi:MFS transporter, OFA family, oxalate/formate antiporter